MKRSVLVMLTVGLLMPALALAAEFAVVTTGGLNLRARATQSSASLGRYAAGAWIRLTGKATGGWYPVLTMDGKRGYMAGNYLRFTPDAQSGSDTARVRSAPGNYVNLRSGPSLETTALLRVASGSTVSVKDARSDWFLVRLSSGGRTYEGYIHNSLLDYGGARARVVTRNGGKVNVRSGPSFAYGSLGSLPTGTQVEVHLRGTGWYWITGGGVTGFMSSSYLSGAPNVGSAQGGGSSPSGTIANQTAWVNNPRDTQVLNLREAPSVDARSIGQYRNGKQVFILARGSTWSQVRVDGRQGYMMTRYLRFTSLSSAGFDEDFYTGGYAEPDEPSYATPLPVRWGDVAPTAPPTVAPIAPLPIGSGDAPSAGQQIQITPLLGGGNTVQVYHDARLTQLKASYPAGKQARMLQYGEYVCMILVDGGVGYISTGNLID